MASMLTPLVDEMILGDRETSALPALGSGDVFLHVAAFLPIRDLACRCLPVSSAWHALLDRSEAAEHLWTAACDRRV